LLNDCRNRWANEHPSPRLALKVSLSLYSAIVLPREVFQLHPNPIARGEMGIANKADDGYAAILEFDCLPNLELLQRPHRFRL
jgi:hypothetical protein